MDSLNEIAFSSNTHSSLYLPQGSREEKRSEEKGSGKYGQEIFLLLLFVFMKT